MIWLTWRQHRGEAFVVGGVLAVLAVFLVVTGRNMADTFQQLGVGACLTGSASNPHCDAITSGFQDQFGFVIGAVAWLNVIPVLLGILVGAPLVARELEAGTHRLVWTQGITRWRWLTAKLSTCW
jgi:ABC-type transport system involved in multi-copper enzyme maturation permease subunit